MRTILIILFLAMIIIDDVSCNFKLLILHTNDMHSRYTEVNHDTLRCQEPSKKCYGGFARIRAAVERFTEEAEKKGMPTLYLDAGDVFQETVFYTEFKWKLAVKMMNLLKPRAVSLGNHEFDDGIEGLAPYVNGVNFPILCCNIDISQEPRLQTNGQIKPSMVITLGKDPDDAKIGIVGYLTREISKKKLGKVKVLDEIQYLRAETKRLKEKEKVDIIIALGHSGYEMDLNIGRLVPNIDVVIGGHSQTFLYNGKAPSDDKVSGPYPSFVIPEVNPEINKHKLTPIVQASYGTKYLGYLELEFDDEWNLIKYKGLPVLLTGEMEQDPEVLAALKPEADIIANKYQNIIGYTEINLQGGSAYCRFRECNIGNMIADAFVDHVNKNYHANNGKPVTIGLVHSGAIKGSLFAKTEEGYTGEITLEDVLTVLPFGCSLKVLEIKGSDLRTVLESTMDKFDVEEVEDGLLQVSGIRITYYLTREKEDRLMSLRVKEGEKFKIVEDNDFYNVVMPDYLAHGHDYKSLAKQKSVVEVNKEEKDYKVVANFIEKQKVFKKRGKYSATEGRISIKIKNKPTMCFRLFC